MKKNLNRTIYIPFFQKIKKIYNEPEKENRFLCIPKVSLEYSLEKLRLLTSMQLDNVKTFNKDLNDLAEFSCMINSPVRSEIFEETVDDDKLWNVYSDILSKSIMAKDSGDRELKEKYSEAMNYLYDDPDGMCLLKPVYEKYKEYNDLYFNQVESCSKLNHDLAALSINTDEYKCKEAELREAREQLEQINHDWLVHGNKNAVEQALSVLEQYAGSHPDMCREYLKESFDKKTDLRKNGEKGDYAVTYLFPSGFENECWNDISLSGVELEELYNEAPNKIKECFGPRTDFDKIISASIEYRSVRVERPWFQDEIMKSRMWRFPKSMGLGQISYANNKSLGRFPASISAVIFIRNLVISYKPEKKEEHINSITIDDRKIRDYKLSHLRQERYANRNAQLFRLSGGNVIPMTPDVERKICQPIEDKKNISSGIVEDNSINVLAFVCKKWGDCPNPDPCANWGESLTLKRLEIKQSPFGVIKAYSSEGEISSCYLQKGTLVKLKACPDITGGYVLKNWRINDVDIVSTKKENEIVLDEDSVVEVIWDKGDQIISTFGLDHNNKKLISWKGADSIVSMNRIASLTDVETIGSRVFMDNKDIQRLSIGSSVIYIEKQAFANCSNLELVEIPEKTRVIDPTAFENRNDLAKWPNFHVDEKNSTYTTIFNHLIERKDVIDLKGAQCKKCQFSIVYKARPKDVKCPYCGGEFAFDREITSKTIRANLVVPKSIDEFDLKARVAKKIKGCFFARSDYRNAFLENAHFDLVYVPLWKYDVKVFSKYSYTKEENIPSPQGQNSVNANSKQPQQKITKTINGEIVQTVNSVLNLSKLGIPKLDISLAAPLSDDIYESEAAIERYSKDGLGATASLKVDVDKKIQGAIQKREGGASLTALNQTNDYSELSYASVLYPLWCCIFEFENSKYRTTVDASNGAITIDYPKDKQKILKVSLIVAVVVLLIIAIFLIIR